MDRVTAAGNDEYGVDGSFCGVVCGFEDEGADLCDAVGGIGGTGDDWVCGSGDGAADHSGDRLLPGKLIMIWNSEIISEGSCQMIFNRLSSGRQQEGNPSALQIYLSLLCLFFLRPR